MDIRENEDIKWYLRPWVVVILLFFVLGPLALPLLYRSPKFTREWKLLLTLLVIISTVYFIFVLIKIQREVYKELQYLLILEKAK